MFIGQYQYSVDNKGRIVIPPIYRNELKDKFIITRGIENCLYIYSYEEWNKIIEKLLKIPFTKSDGRKFIRFFLSSATIVELDKQGRININNNLITYANLKKECIIVGAGKRLEIWSKELWDEFYNSAKDNMSLIAENLFTGSDLYE